LGFIWVSRFELFKVLPLAPPKSGIRKEIRSPEAPDSAFRFAGCAATCPAAARFPSPPRPEATLRTSKADATRQGFLGTLAALPQAGGPEIRNPGRHVPSGIRFRLRIPVSKPDLGCDSVVIQVSRTELFEVLPLAPLKTGIREGNPESGGSGFRIPVCGVRCDMLRLVVGGGWVPFLYLARPRVLLLLRCSALDSCSGSMASPCVDPANEFLCGH